MARLCQLAVVAVALLCALLPFDARAVERWYSTGLYPRLQAVATPISNLVPFALLDVLTVAALALVIAGAARAIARARQTRQWSPIGRALGRLVTAAALVYLAFLALWGFNYRRVSMTERLVLQNGPPTTESVVALGMQAVEQLNALHGSAHAAGWREAPWRDGGLRAAFDEVQRLLVEGVPGAVPGRLKASIYGPYFRWTSVDGMVNPFALEVIANPDLLPFERDFVAAHEWAHLAGFADESEANFVGWLTCLHADVPAQYSAWLFLYWQVRSEIGVEARNRLASALAPGPRADLEAIAERLRRGQLPLLRRASWLAYDQYLRANRIEEGIRSYGAVITLILRARFDGEWTPVRRAAASRPSP